MLKHQIRLCTFYSDSDFLLVYAPIEGPVRLPVLTAPFKHDEVALACSQDSAFHVTKDVVGNALRGILRRRRNEERALRTQEHAMATAAKVCAARQSDDPEARNYAELVERKTRVDAALHKAKSDLIEVQQTASAKHQYLPPAEFRAMRARVDELITKSQALQFELTNSRRLKAAAAQAKSENRSRTRAERFVQAAKEMLDEATWLALWDRVNQEADGEAPQAPPASSSAPV